MIVYLLRRCVSPILVAVFLAQVLIAEEYRTFTSADGRTMEARILNVLEDRVQIESDYGARFTVELEIFSEKDQAHIKEWHRLQHAEPPPAGPNFEALNEAVNHTLFSDDSLWDDDAATLAQRLLWPLESKTDTLASYRLYPGSDYRFLRARPFSAALYAEEGSPTRLSLVYANKGDFPPSNQSNALNAQIKSDTETIQQQLTDLMGEAEGQSFGQGSTYRRVSRWDWRGHSFILSSMQDEYVSLLILKPEMADARGRGERIRRKILVEQLGKNTEQRTNGDVMITNIPMVNQGPKGYCVPATFERALRYMQIPADMYLLAMSGQSSAGGTHTQTFIEGVQRDIRRYNRTLRQVDLRMAIRNVARYIDKGLPIIWTHDSTAAFNQLANTQTQVRQRSTFETYREQHLQAFRDQAEALQRDPRRGHVAMIIGYNRDTDELAISDSWGPAFEIRWVCIEAVQALGRDTYVIDF